MYHVVSYLVALDKLVDEQARFLREQINRAEQAELAVRMQQIRVAQAEARVAAAISSEAVAHENLRRIQDQRVQDWTNSGTPVPAIGETQVLLGTPVIGWGELIGTSQAPPEGTERIAAAGTTEQPRENGFPEDDEEELLIPLEVHSAPEEASHRE